MTTPSRSNPRIFVSHSHKDHDFGIKLIQDLRLRLGNEEAVWYDKSGGLRGGDFWWKKIQKELKERNVFIVLLSPAAKRSKFVKEEIDIALHYSITKRMLVIPLIYLQCPIPDELKRIHTLFYPPLNDYNRVFQELLETLENHFERSFNANWNRPISNRSTTETTIIQQRLLRIEKAFNKGAWSYVIGEVDTLNNQYPGSMPSSLYCLQGLAYLFTGRPHRAQQTFANALLLLSEPEQRLKLLDAYTGIIISRNQWDEVLSRANEALQLAPQDHIWQIAQEEALKKVDNNKLTVTATKQNKTYYLNSASKLGIEVKKAEIKRNEITKRAVFIDREQDHRIETQDAELDMRKALLEIERREVDVQKARLEFEKERMTSAIEMGDLIAEKCYPSSDAEAKATLSRALLRNLIQFGLSKAIERLCWEILSGQVDKGRRGG